jgi:ATP-dependent DNA helicase RecQ
MSQDLCQALQQVLNTYSAGLTEREIRRALIEEHGLRCTPREVREALNQHPDLFVSLAGGTWRSKAVVKAEETAVGINEEVVPERGEIVRPYLADLPPLDTFIAFDLETTGFKPERDCIIQIAAVRIVDGEPASATADDGIDLPPVFNKYVALTGREIPYGLRVKLGFTDHPEWEEQLAQAAPQAEVLGRFQRWAGGLSLLAHNARFDMAFLEQGAEEIGWEIANPVVDSMELACLARAGLGPLRLEDLARSLGISEGLEGGLQVERWAHQQGIGAFSQGWRLSPSGFHNAVVDVLVLAAVVPRLVEAIRRRADEYPLLADTFARLMPDAASRLGIESGEHREQYSYSLSSIIHRPSSKTTSDGASASQLSFTPEGVRVRFERMIEQHDLSRREAQIQMVEHVSRALQDDRFMAVEAPTGTGKTFAYLIPAVFWAQSQGEPVVISTYTRLLQDQMKNDLERLGRYLETDFHAQVLKGMQNYLCLERAKAVYAQADLQELDIEERFAWLILLAWLSETRDGMLDEISYWARNTFPALARVCQSLRAEHGECSHERCPSSAFCFHRQAYQRALEADVVIMNHALLLSKEWEQAGFPFVRVVVDEAHNLEDATTAAATDEVTWESIIYLVNRLLDRRSGQGVLIRVRDKVREAKGQRLIARALHQRNLLGALAQDFGQQLRRFVELNRAQVDPRYGASLALAADPRRANPLSWKPVEKARRQLSKTLRETGQAVRRLHDWLGEHPLPAFQEQTRNELYYLSDQMAQQAGLLEDLLRVGYDRLVRVHWIEVERVIPPEDLSEVDDEYEGPYRWAVKRAPVRVGSYLNELVYKNCRSLVLTSATLRTTREAGFGFLLDRLGLLDRVESEDAIALPPELDYGRALFAVARYMRSDARPSEIQNFVEEVGQELAWFYRFTGGNGLTLFTARKRMLEVFQELEPALGEHSIPVGCQGETGSRRALLNEIRARPGSVLLGLKSFWEGVDVPGPNISYVVMEKLPFPLLGDPMIRARAAEVRERDGHEFADYILPLMLVDFKQGFGRLIRGEDDIGAVILLDKRVWNREYRRDLHAALPGMDRTDDSGKGPRILEDETLLSRRAVYRAIADHMAQAPPRWQIDLERIASVLAEVPERLLTGLEQLLKRLQLPRIVSPERLQALWHRVIRGMREVFGFQDWRPPEQESVVRAALTGEDALVILPTGSGKSFTFQLPALLREGTTLIFSPLKALMKDQVDQLLNRGLAIAERVDSSQTAEEQERVYQRMEKGTVQLVYVAPERVRDPRLLAALKSTQNIVQVVVDEAHCVHTWGYSFRPDFLYIRQLVDIIEETQGWRPPVAALTATATPRVRASIADRLDLQPDYREIERNPNRPELRFVVYNDHSPGFQIASKRDKLRILLRILRAADRRDENAVVYANTTRETERLARRLEIMGLNARHYHGQMDDQARKETQDMFLDGQINIIVATKAFGMGIDKPDIRYVVHYQIPGDIESYFQEAGRAGRDGETSWCVLLYHEDDLWIHENYFIPNSLPEPEQVGNVLTWLRRRCGEDASPFYVDPQEMAGALGFEEDRELGIHLHLLEEMGFIQRDVDVTLKASTRLLTSLDRISAQAQEIVPGPVGEAIGQVLEAHDINQVTRGELPLLEAALAAEMDPLALDEALYQLALQGLLIYRGFARAFTLAPEPKMLEGKALDLSTGEARRVREEMEQNLTAMRRYAESLHVGDCLRGEILEYLGAEKPSTPTDECCSLCDVNLGVPWADEPAWEDLTIPSRYQDVKYTTLKATVWNEELKDVRGRAPYGAWTMAQILVGNDYMATKYQEDPERKRKRRRQIMSSPYFGLLEGLRGGSETVLDLLDALEAEGYVEEVERRWDGGSYAYPAPTGKGKQRLREGRLFEESDDSA